MTPQKPENEKEWKKGKWRKRGKYWGLRILNMLFWFYRRRISWGKRFLEETGRNMLNKCRLTVTLTNISFLEWAKGTQWIYLFIELCDRNPPRTHPDSVDGDPRKSSASQLRGAAGRHGDSERELTPRLATIGYVGRLTNTQTQLNALADQISKNMQKHCKRNFSESTLCYAKTTQIQPSSSGPEERIKSALLLAAAQQIKPSAMRKGSLGFVRFAIVNQTQSSPI